MVDFEVLFRASPNPYVLVSPDFTIVEANEAYLQVTGARREDIIGSGMFESFPGDPDDPEGASTRQLRRSFERVLEEKERDTLAMIRYPIQEETEDGVVFRERFWSATHTPILDEEGEVAYILQHTVDVTDFQKLKRELRQAEKALGSDDENRQGPPKAQVEEGVFRRAQAVQEANRMLEAERRLLRRFFEQAPGFMAFLDGPDHVFELANDAYYQLIGHRDIINKPVHEALPEVEGQGFIELLDQVYETGEPHVGREVEVRLEREPGGELEPAYVDFVYQPIITADGSVTGIFVQGHDVTEQKQVKDELRRYRNHLEELMLERTRELEESQAALRQAQKMEAVGKLTGGVAHDFNNLLQVIGGNLQLLERDVADTNDAVRRRLQTARGAVERGAKLSSQLLAFARRQPLEPQVIRPAQLLGDIDTLLQRTLDETIEIETVAEDELWNILVDPNQLENVILNLAINSRDAMDGEGKLTIEAENTRLDEDYARRHSEVTPGPYVLLAISDNGCGMPPEDVEHAFEPFFTTKPEDEGTGLGLSMAYGFTKQSGGHIKIYSEVGEGTTVKLYLPRTLESVSEEDEMPPAHGPIEGARGETILVVEDDENVRHTAVEMLTDLGYDVLEASSAERALAVLESGVEVDLVFTDVVMPGSLRSPELARRAKELLPDVEVLFTSGYTENAIVHRGELDPGVSLLSKPYSREELARKIRYLLRGREQRKAAEEAARTNEQQEMAALQDGEADVEEDLRILLVEDDESVQLFVSEAVRELGYDVVAVSSAEEAIEAFEKSKACFHALFTDVSLPGISGMELAKELRERQPNLEVIVASGYGSTAEVKGENGLEGALTLPKPYDLPDVQAALEKILGDR